MDSHCMVGSWWNSVAKRSRNLGRHEEADLGTMTFKRDRVVVVVHFDGRVIDPCQE